MKKLSKSMQYNLFLLFISLSVLILGIGYASITTVDLDVNGTASIEYARDIIIKNVEYVSNNNANTSLSTINNYYLTLLDSTIVLGSSVPSSITYEVTLRNNSNEPKTFDQPTYLIGTGYDNTDIVFSLNGLNNGDVIAPGAEKTFTITFEYDSSIVNPTNNTLNSLINFDFGVSNKIAKIGNTFYDSLQEALDDVPTTGALTTVVLLNDTAENVVVDSGQNVMLDLNNKTLSALINDAAITNDGRIEVSNGVITCSFATGAINNNSTGTFIINSGSIIATGTKQAIYNNGGTVEIGGSALLQNNVNNRAAVHNLNNGRMTITGGTIISTNYSGVKNESGTLIIGTKDGDVSPSAPEIRGKTYGVESSVSFNYYDGIIKGRTASFNDESKIGDSESGYDLLRKTEKIDGVNFHTTRLAIIFVVTYHPEGGTASFVTQNVERNKPIGELPTATKTGFLLDGWFTSASGGTQVTVNTVITADTDFYAQWGSTTVAMIGTTEYDSIATAVSNIPTNTPTTINITRDVEISDVINNLGNKTITFDLQGHTITLTVNNRPVFENFTGNITITNGKIVTEATQGAVNNRGASGTTTLTNLEIVATGTRQAVYNEYGTMIIGNNCNFSSTTSERATVHNLNGGTMIITGGTFYSSGFSAVKNDANSTLTIGSKDGVISTSIPNMRGKTYGVENYGTLKYYDGILKGITGALSGNIADQETGSQTVSGTETIDGNTYNTMSLN